QLQLGVVGGDAVLAAVQNLDVTVHAHQPIRNIEALKQAQPTSKFRVIERAKELEELLALLAAQVARQLPVSQPARHRVQDHLRQKARSRAANPGRQRLRFSTEAAEQTQRLDAQRLQN